MKNPSRPSLACCAALLALIAPLTARAVSNTLVLTDSEPQYASKLCWAAADVLAVNQFYQQCPTSPAPTTALFPTSQGLDAGYHAWIFSANPPLGPLAGFLTECENNIQGPGCNDWDTPPLRGLSFKTGTGPMGLDWDAARQEIDAGRPFLFQWDYPDNGTSADSPVGLHQLVATGYSDQRDESGTKWLQIWDPWPVPKSPPSSVPACGPASGVQVTAQHSQWIHFSTYGDPMSDMGVAAVHASDQWGLAKQVPAAPVLTVDGGAPSPASSSPAPESHKLVHPPLPPLPQIEFAEARRGAQAASRRVELQASGVAPRVLGVPFPIVGLGFEQLVRGRNYPTRLLTGTTSAILFPVEFHGEVVDAFLMLFVGGHWQRGGYANLEITQRLVDVRAHYAAQQKLSLSSFYMVSVPGEVAFFAAHGQGKLAVLIPASTDPSIGAIAGRPTSADQQLRRLILAVQHDLRPRPPRRGDPTRRGDR